MKALDFEFDSIRLSDKNFMLCRFDGGGMDTINMPEITFNTVSTAHGLYNHITSTTHEDYLTFTLQICKNNCNDSNMEISVDDFRDLTRWLCRKSFHKFKLIDDELSGIYFMTSFNLSRIEIDGKLVGVELNAITNSPYAFAEDVVVRLDVEPNEEINIYNKSDLEGHIYPNLKIILNGSGDFEMRNKTEDRIMKIRNVAEGEVVTINYPMISSSVSSHKIQNDFNFVFFRLVSTFKDGLNVITTTLPCSIELTYSPIVKVGI